MSFGPHTITKVPRGWDGSTRDAENNPVITDGTPVPITGCFVQQMSAEEYLEARESGVSRWVVFVPPGNTFGLIDHVRIAAAVAHTDPDPGESYATFRVAGDPDGLDHIDGSFHHFELILERVQL